MADRKAREYVRKIEQLIDEAGSLSDSAVRRAASLLREAQKNVLGELAAVETEFNTFILGRLEEAVSETMEVFAERYGSELTGFEAKAAAVRAEGFKRAAQDFGLAVRPVPRISPTLVEIVQGNTVELVQDVGSEVAKKINREIRQAALGGKTPADAMNAIGRTLKDPGPFRNGFGRAERITRTELSRTNQIAGQARMKQMNERVAEIEKQWWASFIMRTEHIAVHLQRRKVDRPFSVAGESLMYPVDPGGSAENTVFCTCNSVPYVPALEDALPVAA